MAKKDLNYSGIFRIFFKGIGLYFMNFEKFMKYMAFPVLGQIVGVIIIFTATYFFTVYIPDMTKANPIFDNILFVFLTLLVFTLPGFFIFCKAFWDYLVAMASLNSMASYIIESGNKLEDTSIHDGLIKGRTLSYIFFLIILSVIYAIGSFPLMWVLMAIAFIYLSLSFQAFALEEDKSAFEALGLSINLVKYNALKTLLLLLLLGITTYWLVPYLICWGADKANLIGFFSYPVERFITLLPVKETDEILRLSHIPVQLNTSGMAKTVTMSILAFAITAFTLPIRSICCTMLFKELYAKNYAGKVASEKLVKKAKKKIADE